MSSLLITTIKYYTSDFLNRQRFLAKKLKALAPSASTGRRLKQSHQQDLTTGRYK